MASISDLPPEVLFIIGTYLSDNTSPRDLAALMKATRKNHHALNPLLYATYGRRAVVWAAKRGVTKILDRVTQLSGSPNFAICPLRPFYPGQSTEPHENTERWETLHIAANSGRDNVVTWLLDHGASLTAIAENGCPCDYFILERRGRNNNDGPTQCCPLYLAIVGRHSDTALLLLSRGAPLYINKPQGGAIATALQAAARNCLPDVVRYIKNVYLPPVEGQPSDESSSATSDAAGAISAVGGGRCNVEDSSEKNDPTSSVDPDSSTSGHSVGPRFPTAKIESTLWASQWDSNQTPGRPPMAFTGSDGRSALYHLVFCNDYNAIVAMAKDLKELGHDINLRSYRNMTPLDYACAQDNFIAASAFLAVKAKPTKTGEVPGINGTLRTAILAPYVHNALTARIYQSVRDWHVYRISSVINMVMDESIDVDEHFGSSALMETVNRELVEETSILLMGGADPNYRPAGESHSPLGRAASSCNVEIMRLLLDARAHVNDMVFKRYSALEIVLRRRYEFGAPECVALLLWYGAVVHKRGPRVSRRNLLASETRRAMAGRENVLDTLLQHATAANIDVISWTQAVAKAFYGRGRNETACRMLRRFGAEAGYSLDADW